MPPILPTPTKYPSKIIACTGDSLTNNNTLGVFDFEFWPTQLEKLLDSTATILDGLTPASPLRCNCKVRNMGKNGNTSGPLPVTSATVNTVTDTTHVTMTAVSGQTPKAGQTFVINGQITAISSYNSGSGAAVLTIPLSGGTTSGHAYPAFGLSDFGTDVVTRAPMVLGKAPMRSQDLLFQFGKPEWDPPDVLAVWIGVNDPGGGTVHISALNLNTSIKTAPTQSASPWPQGTAGVTLVPLQTGQGANAVVGQLATIVDWTSYRVWIGMVVQVSGDTLYLSANSHAIDLNNSAWSNWYALGANPLPGPMPPVGAAVYQGTEANIIALVMLAYNAGVTRFLVANAQYLNYSAGGDTLVTPYATYATLRAGQADAVAKLQAQGVDAVLVDLYTYMRNRIVNGDWFSYGPTVYAAVQGDHAWHVADANQHLNPLGNAMVAQAFLATIQSQPGWLDQLHVA